MTTSPSGPVGVERVDSEAGADRVDPGRVGPAAELGEPVQRVGIVEAPGQRRQLPRRIGEESADRGGGIGYLLGVVAEPATAGDRAAVRGELAGEYPQQRGLADAVRADEADPVPAGQRERQPLEKRLAVDGDSEIDSLQQGRNLRDIGRIDHRECRG